MSDLLCITMELFLSYQDRPGTFDVILGHIPSFSYGDDRSLADMLHFSSLDREISYLLHRSLFLWFSSRWAFSGAWRSGCDCPTIHDPANSFDEIVVVTLADYSLETPQWITHLRWRWIPPAEHFELETFDSLWHLVRPRDSNEWVTRLCL